MPAKRIHSISSDKLAIVRDLYFNKKYCVREIAEHFNVSPHAVRSFIVRHNIIARNRVEARRMSYDRQPLSFAKRLIDTPYLQELAVAGVMLYWAEGYKGNKTTHMIDFVNSDPQMIRLFLHFFRTIYQPSEKKMRIYLYCYSDQDVSGLIDFWSATTGISRDQFTKPYVRNDFKKDGRKMKYGVIHVRYNDKKLLLDIKNMIHSYGHKYAPIG